MIRGAQTSADLLGCRPPLVRVADDSLGGGKPCRASRISYPCLRCAALDLIRAGSLDGLRLLYVQHLAHDAYQNVSFLLRLPQPCNHYGEFIEYLVPALYLTAIFSVLHGFISNEGESRLAVSKILKGSHIVHAVYGLMFYSIVRRLNLVSLRVGKVHGGNDLFVRNNLVVFTGIPELLAIRSSHAAEKFSSHAKIHLAKRRDKTLRAPPLHYILRVRPRLPNQFAWGIENSRDNHTLCLANGVFCHL